VTVINQDGLLICNVTGCGYTLEIADFDDELSSSANAAKIRKAAEGDGWDIAKANPFWISQLPNDHDFCPLHPIRARWFECKDGARYLVAVNGEITDPNPKRPLCKLGGFMIESERRHWIPSDRWMHGEPLPPHAHADFITRSTNRQATLRSPIVAEGDQ